MKARILLLFLLLLTVSSAWAQTQLFAEAAVSESVLRGVVVDAQRKPIAGTSIYFPEERLGVHSDEMGRFVMEGIGEESIIKGELVISALGYETRRLPMIGEWDLGTIILYSRHGDLEELVVTGTQVAVRKDDSPVPVEIYGMKYFEKNPSGNLFASLSMVNGIQPQLNCQVCNTGDIHINGMEGPYTMILIDGMPIVSGLSTVYGLSGIPNSMIQRIEVVKGPASALYGSEAMGGIINVITRSPQQSDRLHLDLMGSSWGEGQMDLAAAFHGKRWSSLHGLSLYHYTHPLDQNGDGFTDLTLQKRGNFFQKWERKRPGDRVASIGIRYVYEDRWGGQMDYKSSMRGSDQIYGESIETRRWELMGTYEFKFRNPWFLQFSYNFHDQDSWYGITPYRARQQIGFLQTYGERKIQSHHLVYGAALRYTWYDDNTPATQIARGDTLVNQPHQSPMPGLFIQDEWTWRPDHKLLLGFRMDLHRDHGLIPSPRLAYWWRVHPNGIMRWSAGTGFRVVQVFTEDHAALTGARELVISESLDPERSYNLVGNLEWKLPRDRWYLSWDLSAFYTHFTNQIIADYDTRPGQIRYANLQGYAVSRGISLNARFRPWFPLEWNGGLSWMDVFKDETASGREREKLYHSPSWTFKSNLSYRFGHRWTVDLTQETYGPMRLPVFEKDYRPAYSPWFTLANLQVRWDLPKQIQIYGGIKNLLDFVPQDPIMRPEDPFNRYVDDPVTNPHGYQFDPGYNYASMQGRRYFLGLRWSMTGS